MSRPKTICLECRHCKITKNQAWAIENFHCQANPPTDDLSPVTGQPILEKCHKKNKGNCPDFERPLVQEVPKSRLVVPPGLLTKH